jgi:hypothetical protein
MALRYDTRNLHGLGGRSEELQTVMDLIESDIANKASSTDLGTAAAEDVGYFATAAQGTLADNAQPKTGNTFTVATLPAAASNVGRVVYCSDGSAGSPCAVISDGTDWKVVAIGLTAAAE